MFSGLTQRSLLFSCLRDVSNRIPPYPTLSINLSISVCSPFFIYISTYVSQSISTFVSEFPSLYLYHIDQWSYLSQCVSISLCFCPCLSLCLSLSPHTHTHTHIYIYIYIYFRLFLYIDLSIDLSALRIQYTCSYNYVK